MQYPLSFYFLTMMSLFLVFATGSRGGVICLIFLCILYCRYLFCGAVIFRPRNFIKYIFIIILLFIIYYLLFNDLFTKYFWRLLYFSSEGSSISVRNDMYYKFFEYIPYLNIDSIFFGVGVNSKVWNFYPHNIFIELIIYYGFIYGMLPILSYYLFLMLYSRSINLAGYTDRLLLFFLPIYIGSLFSGSLYESFTLICIPFAIFLNTLKKSKNENLFIKNT